MKLTLRQKENFYHELGELAKAGITFASAIDTLSDDTPSGPLRRLMRKLRKSVKAGLSVGDAFRAQRGAVGEMEAGIITATEQSGHLDEGCKYLSGYFAAMERARAIIIKGCAYPVFVLHLGVFSLDLPELVAGGNVQGYLKHTVGLLALLYVAVFVILTVSKAILSSAERSVIADSLTRVLPILGGIRRALTLERFAATYDMQLRAGINVIDSLDQAARASQSAWIISAIRKIIPKVRKGGQVGPLLSGYSVFGKDLVRAIRIGEETGALDHELPRMTLFFRESANRRIEFLSEWTGRILYLIIAAYVGYRIVKSYQDMFTSFNKQFDL